MRVVHTKNRTRLLLAGVTVLSIAGLACSASASTLCVNTGGTGGCSASISAAVAAAAPGDVIQVWPGVYREDVVINKSLSLISVSPLDAIIDANGLANGIWVNGMSAAPKPGVANVVISGFMVRNAKYEGILLTNATNVTLVGNEVTLNDAALSNETCPGIPAFETNEAADCGEGIHLMAVDHSTILRNEVSHNGGGILITDETGPNDHNLITENFVHDNSYDCGITLASHAPAKTVIPTATLSYGVWYNTISHNVSMRNGTIHPVRASASLRLPRAPRPRATSSSTIRSSITARPVWPCTTTPRLLRLPRPSTSTTTRLSETTSLATAPITPAPPPRDPPESTSSARQRSPEPSSRRIPLTAKPSTWDSVRQPASSMSISTISQKESPSTT
jgi:hypothetical protein